MGNNWLLEVLGLLVVLAIVFWNFWKKSPPGEKDDNFNEADGATPAPNATRRPDGFGQD